MYFARDRSFYLNVMESCEQCTEEEAAHHHGIPLDWNFCASGGRVLCSRQDSVAVKGIIQHKHN
jgi:hypothetical protein